MAAEAYDVEATDTRCPSVARVDLGGKAGAPIVEEATMGQLRSLIARIRTTLQRLTSR